jgi:hypothetical protein
MVRVIAVVLTLTIAMLPVAQYASAASYDGHDASMRHAARTQPGSARVAIETRIDLTSAVPVPTVSIAPSPPSVTRPARPLAAPFVPPRG